MEEIIKTLFSWPNGIVLGNLIASAMWALPTIVHLDRLARKHHRQHMERIERHFNAVRNQDEE